MIFTKLNRSRAKLKRWLRPIIRKYFNFIEAHRWRLNLLCVFFVLSVVIIQVYVIKKPIAKDEAALIYSILASSAANIIGYSLAGLALVAGFIPKLAESFSPQYLRKIFYELSLCSVISIMTFTSSMMGLLFKTRWDLMVITVTACLFYTGMLRTLMIVIHVISQLLHHELRQQALAKIRATSEHAESDSNLKGHIFGN